MAWMLMCSRAHTRTSCSALDTAPDVMSSHVGVIARPTTSCSSACDAAKTISSAPPSRGWRRSVSSRDMGASTSPPRLIISRTRPVRVRRPLASSRPRSPVGNASVIGGSPS